MVEQFVAGLARPISIERLASYRPPEGSDLDMLIAYFWNLTLSEALYPTVQALEVALRNTIHAAVATGTGTGTDLWFDWPGLLLPREQGAIAQTRLELVRDAKPQNVGRVIAGLRFGFWTSILSRPYEQSRWHADNLALLRTAFPHAPRRFRSRGAVWVRCNEIRLLRNRLVHAEPVWNRADLLRDHRHVIDAVGWISPPLRGLLIGLDRFPVVFRDGRGAVEAVVRQRLEGR